ncbi:MAG: B12-binding domain-containing radical SAM protein [Desulfobacterales bacterium]|nr:MAG: B12-binding domain-containing radical SAM protein [Desulfobacterales bacterium]
MHFNKILLIQPMHEKQNNKKKKKTSIAFPWGLATLASYYREAGYDVSILDGQAMQLPKEELLPEIDKFDFDIVGITSFSTQYPAVKMFAKYIKENRNVPVIVGGPLATYQAEMVLQTTDADVCVIGEGEIAGLEILQSWKNLAGVKGIAFRQNGKIVMTSSQDRFVDLDQLPLPDFSLFDMEKYVRHKNKFAGSSQKGIRAMTFITSRGCPYRCHFCSKSCQSFRSLSPNKLYEMIARLKNEFKLDEIYFGDELFLSSKSKFKELAPLLSALNLPWAGQARVNLVDKEFLGLIKTTNCVGIGYGIESGSQKILNNMNKKTTVKQIESAMIYTQQLKIPIKVQLIFGYPGEDETTLQETIELFKRVDHPGRRFTVITPIPGSKLYDDCLTQGLIKDEPAYITALEKSFGMGEVHVNFTKWPDDEIYPRKQAVEEAIFKNYHYKNLIRRTKYYFSKLYKT